MSKLEKIESEKTITIKTFEDFQVALKPFIGLRVGAKVKVDNLLLALGEYQKKYEAIEKKLTALLVEAEKSITDTGKIKFTDVIFATKQEKTDLEQWINQIEREMLPQAQVALEVTNKTLGEEFLKGIDFLKISYMEILEAKYTEIENIWAGYFSEIQKLIQEFGIRFPSYEYNRVFVLPAKLLQRFQRLFQ